VALDSHLCTRCQVLVFNNNLTVGEILPFSSSNTRAHTQARTHTQTRTYTTRTTCRTYVRCEYFDLSVAGWFI
jgi:type II secretory ATPase GspE/PulE/Tfp pilus assembly ATPase PilB-like protein